MFSKLLKAGLTLAAVVLAPVAAMAQDPTPLESVASSFDPAGYQSMIATVAPGLFGIAFAVVAVTFVLRKIGMSGR